MLHVSGLPAEKREKLLQNLDKVAHIFIVIVYYIFATPYTDKKENKIFLIYREIQMGSGAKSNIRKGFLIHEEMHKYFHHM
jgi:hypothetical protein